jgi:hypothetical protein
MPPPTTQDDLPALRTAYTPDGRQGPVGSRVAVYSAICGSLGAMPLPWVPEALVRRVRGALAQDIAARHGVSLAPDARALLAEPSSSPVPRSLGVAALRFVGVHVVARGLARFGPVGGIWALRHALRAFVFGHLFDRYLGLARTERAVRIDRDEAQRVRAAIDGALGRAFRVEAAPVIGPTPIDDQRDATTALLDGLLGLAAGMPEVMTHRLDAAFDEIISKADPAPAPRHAPGQASAMPDD